MQDKFSINKFGVKVLHETSFSFQTYSQESVSLEFFLIYLILAEHNNLGDKKKFLKEIYIKKDDDKVDKALLAFIESEKSDLIFSLKTHESYFGQMAYTRIADNTLCYFKDLIVEVVRKKPEILKSNEKETLEYIFSFDNMEKLIMAVTEKKINELFYGSIIDIEKYFNDRLGVKLFQNEDEKKNFNQFIKQRNLIVHNRGIITKEFSKEFSTDKINYVIGEKLLFNYEMLSNINGVITNFISELDMIICQKFKLETVKAI